MTRISAGMMLFLMVFATVSLAEDGDLKWDFRAGDRVHGSPAIGFDGTIYVGSDDKNLYAINPDGTKKWTFRAFGDVHYSPAIGADGTIYVGAANAIYAINPDGTEKWVFRNSVWAGGALFSPAIGADGTIYVGSADYSLHAINPDGTEKWKFSTGGYVFSSPAISTDGTIYVGSDDEDLYAINPDGTKKWRFRGRNSQHVTRSSPAIGADGTIYVGLDIGYLYAINPDGTEKWRFASGHPAYSSPAIGFDGTVYMLGFYSHVVYAIEGSSGGLADSPWPMFGHDVRHTGRVGASMEPLPNQPPVALFALMPESSTANEEITFDASGSNDPDGQVVSYEWGFGDGVTVSGQIVKHAYNAEGSYLVSLEITDDAGEKTVFSKQVEVMSVASLEALINTKLLQTPIYPLYLLDMESFLDQVNTKWQNFTAWLLPGNSVDDYDELFCTGIEYDSLRYMSLIRARDFLNAGDVGNAKAYLAKSDTYEEMSQISFQGAAHVFDASSEAAQIIAESIRDGCQASVKFGLKVTCPAAAKGADFLYDVLDMGIEHYLGNEEEAVKDFLKKRAIKLLFDEIPFDHLGGETISDWIKDQTGEFIFPALAEVTGSLEWSAALSKVIEETAESLVREDLVKVTDLISDEAAKMINSLEAELGSPADIRVYDSEGRVTGLVDGKVMNEIPCSVYNNESVIIFFPNDVYRYEVAGTEDGEYGLEVVSTVNAENTTFIATDIPISATAVHQYSVDWNDDEKGTTLLVDDDGDGVPEHTVVADSELTSEEYLSVAGVTPHDSQVITWGKVRKTDLLQNYPNPFNPETWIPYSLAEQAKVVVEIHSTSGQLIRRFDLGTKPTDAYLSKEKAVYWDGCDSSGESVASGVYFYTIQAGDFTATRKMVIVR